MTIRVSKNHPKKNYPYSLKMQHYMQMSGQTGTQTCEAESSQRLSAPPALLTDQIEWFSAKTQQHQLTKTANHLISTRYELTTAERAVSTKAGKRMTCSVNHPQPNPISSDERKCKTQSFLYDYSGLAPNENNS